MAKVVKVVLRKVLKEHHLSARQFAKLLKIDYSNVWRLLRGGDPKLSTLTKWAKVIGCKVRDLIEE